MGRHRHTSAIEPLESRVLFSTGELIRNGSFEGVVPAGDWNRTGAFQADARFTNVKSGLGYAYFSNTDGSAGNNLGGQMFQQLSIPNAATELKLSFWTRITTSETTTTAANDTLKVEVRSSDGATLLHSVATLSNLNASSSYVKRTYTVPIALKGQSVRIAFTGATNASNGTTFRVDDVGLSSKAPDTAKKIVGYLPYYRQSSFANIDLTQVTHINYFSVQATTTGSLSAPNINDANLATVVNAAHAKGVGVSITVGPQSFGTLAADSTARIAFATNIVAYAVARNLDGIDIDWEPPATGQNYANYALLLQALYDRINAVAPQLKLTAATNPWTQEIPVAATNLMDWVNVMCYDFDYANNSTYEAAIDGMIQWSDYGVEKHKLLMGTPFYGRSGTSWSDTSSKTYNGFFNEYVAKNGAPPSPDTDAFTDANGKTWIVNGVTTIQKKMAWVRDNGYGGAMIWELGQDHWDASGKYDQYSLLPVMNSMLRPPSWLSPASGSRFDFVAGKFIHSFGTVTFTGNANTNVEIRSGATAILNATQKWLNLAIAPGGKLDLKMNDLVINYSGASPLGSRTGTTYTGLLGLVQSGSNHGAWNGSGILSSSAASASPQGLTTIAIAGATQVIDFAGATTKVWNGVTIDTTSVLLKYTYAGDANFDGRISGDDYAAIDFNVRVPNAFGYFNGDFNYDGQITGDDYSAIDLNLAAQGAPL